LDSQGNYKGPASYEFHGVYQNIRCTKDYRRWSRWR